MIPLSFPLPPLSSCLRSPKFISDFQLDLKEVAQPLEAFKTFNDFFTRKLKPAARPIAAVGDASVASSPADARTVVFENISQARAPPLAMRSLS